MSDLEARKQLLVTESELNRSRLAEEWAELKLDVHDLVEHGRPLGSLIVSAAGLASVFTAIRRVWPDPSPRRNGKRSWISRMLNGVQTGAALWQAVRRSRAP
jgi:hypothetical protein